MKKPKLSPSLKADIILLLTNYHPSHMRSFLTEMLFEYIKHKHATGLPTGFHHQLDAMRRLIDLMEAAELQVRRWRKQGVNV